jgi:NADPH:quinone reductase-like Zn-dependent oxidoreductase
VDYMKAVRIHEFGGPETLKYEDVQLPVPAAGEVLVHACASGVNPVDWKVRAGYLKDSIQYKLPLIIGWDVSGVIEAVAVGVDGWNHGDEVYAHPDITRDGSYAQFIRIRATAIARKPKTLGHVQAAAIPLAALTAWQSLFDAGGLTRGQTVLIHAAAGGVGHLAVQLAKWKGARVVGTASKANAALVQELGADEVIDYTARRFEDALSGVDLVLDTIGGEVQQRSWAILKSGGILVSTVGLPPAEVAVRQNVRVASPFVQPNATQLAEISHLVDAGQLRPIVEAVLPLAEARRAHEISQRGHTRGKTVLSIS